MIVCLLHAFLVISKSYHVFCIFSIARVEPTCVEVSLQYLLLHFFDTTYEPLLQRRFVWNEKTYFYLIWCWFIFSYLINKSFCPAREFVFCNKLDRIRRQNLGAKVAQHANIPKSNIKCLTHTWMFWWCWNSTSHIF